MFDWLFGDGGKGLEQQQKQLRESQYNQQYGRTMSSAMNDIFSDPANAELVAQAGADFGNNWNDQANSIRGEANRNQSSIDDMQKQYESAEKANRHNYFGNGLLGALLNPIGQTASAVTDLATGDYAKNGRDVWSDLGAAGETALTVLPGVGAMAKGLKLGKVANGLDKFNKAAYTIPGSIASGAAFGGLDNVRQNGAQSDPMDVLGSMGTGAAFGGAIPMVGKIGGNMLQKRGTNVLQKSMAQSGIDTDVAQQLLGATPKRALYQEALRSYIPKSTFGKVALGGGALYGGSQLMGMMNPQQPQTLEDYYAMQNGGY